MKLDWTGIAHTLAQIGGVITAVAIPGVPPWLKLAGIAITGASTILDNIASASTTVTTSPVVPPPSTPAK